MLDNVIDINYYSVPQARNSNMRHRPVGLGLMGFQDALYRLRIPYGSDAAVAFADSSMEAIGYYAIDASCRLAKERGAYAELLRVAVEPRHPPHRLSADASAGAWRGLSRRELRHQP